MNLLSVITLFTLMAVAEPAKKPFWRENPQVYKQVVDQKRVFVSVTEGPKVNDEHVMSLKGGGQIRAPKDFTLPRILDFKSAFKNSAFVKKVQVNEKDQSLFILAEVYGFKNSMKIRWKIEKDDEDLSLVKYEVVHGIMEGFAWDLTLEPAKGDRTDVGIDGVYKYKKFPMPAFFLKFGLEVIFQKVAIDLRAHVEESLKNETRKK